MKKENRGDGSEQQAYLRISGIWAEKELGCRCCWVEEWIIPFAVIPVISQRN